MRPKKTYNIRILQGKAKNVLVFSEDIQASSRYEAKHRAKVLMQQHDGDSYEVNGG